MHWTKQWMFFFGSFENFVHCCNLYAPLYVILSQNFLFLEHTAKSRRRNFCRFYCMFLDFLQTAFCLSLSHLPIHIHSGQIKHETGRQRWIIMFGCLFFRLSEYFPYIKVQKGEKGGKKPKTTSLINYENKNSAVEWSAPLWIIAFYQFGFIACAL